MQVPDCERQVIDVDAVAPDGADRLFGVTDTSRPNPSPKGHAGRARNGVFAILHVTVVTRDGRPIPPAAPPAAD